MNLIWSLISVYVEILKFALAIVGTVAFFGFIIFATCLFFYMMLL